MIAGIAGILSPLENAARVRLARHLHDTVGLPWGWSIVALTIIVRIALVPLMVKQIHSMQRMQAHTPQMKAIQQKYKDDKQKLNEELMRFYKENKINPAASCLPMLVQIPVFFALYFVLRDFAKHVDALAARARLADRPNITEHVTAHWSGYVLLVLYVGSQVGYAYFGTPPNVPKSQRMLFMVVPFFIVPFVSRFPVGLAALLDDDEPVDGRPGARHAPAGAEADAAPEALVADAAASRRSATDGEADDDAAGSARAGRRGRRRPARPRRVKRKKKRADGERDDEQRRPGVEATGETVGEAKWQALRELERLASGARQVGWSRSR